jgi:chromosome segregation ATPase
LDATNREVHTLKSRIEELNNQMANKNNALNSELENSMHLRAIIEQLNVSEKRLTDKINENDIAIALLESDQKALINDLTIVKKENSDLQAIHLQCSDEIKIVFENQISTLLSELESLKSIKLTLEIQIEGKNSEISKLQSRNSSFEMELQNAQTQLKYSIEAMKSEDVKLGEIVSQIQSLTDDLHASHLAKEECEQIILEKLN